MRTKKISSLSLSSLLILLELDVSFALVDRKEKPRQKSKNSLIFRSLNHVLICFFFGPNKLMLTSEQKSNFVDLLN
jgi:hypothetical protein